MINVIEVSSLSKFYGKARGIVDVSFFIPKGVIFGFIGPNGAGKSTTIRILLSLIYPSSGYAAIFGMDCTKLGHKIRERVGYIPAETHLYDDMKVRDFVKYAARFYKNISQKRIDFLCDRLDIELNKRISDLSTGNKKKLSIMQALIHEPELLILDEPTTGLDPLMQNRLYDILKSEKAQGKTIFFSSHILSEVQKMCDEVAIIKEGRILDIENIDMLRSNYYKKMKIEFRNIYDAESFEPEKAVILNRTGRRAEFIFHGDMNLIIKSISAYEIDNLWIDEPALEDIFINYYQKE